MKKMTNIALLAGGILGLIVVSHRVLAADGTASTTSSCGMSCCGGMGEAAATSATSTNAVPDLLATCPVSGDKLGEMGAPYVFTYKNQEVKLCCPMCKKSFDKNPDKYIGAIRGADKKP